MQDDGCTDLCNVARLHKLFPKEFDMIFLAVDEMKLGIYYERFATPAIGVALSLRYRI